MYLMLSYKPPFQRSIVAAILLSSMVSTQAFADLTTTQTQQFLIIATGSGDNGHVFNNDGGELGADQEVVMTGNQEVGGEHSSFVVASGTNLKDKFLDTNRWVNHDTPDGGEVGKSDYLKGAKILGESPDYTGNVAILGESATFTTTGTDYFANLGIKCAGDVSVCSDNDSKISGDSWKKSDDDDFEALATGSGVSMFDSGDPLALLHELDHWETFLRGLKAEYVIKVDGNKIEKENYAEGTGPYTLDLDKIDSGELPDNFSDKYGKTKDYFDSESDNYDLGYDGYGDGIAVIDIDAGNGNDFNINETDWILQTTGATLAVIRMIGTGNVLIDYSSIMMSCTDKGENHCETEEVTELGALFFIDHAKGNQVFNVNNSILGGIGLWDMSDTKGNQINFNNVQGCTQLISQTVNLSSANRLNRCALAHEGPKEVPEPTTLLLFSSMLLILMRIRSKQAS